MPRPIQTLPFAQALTRIFRLQGKAKMESDETVVPTVSFDITDSPWFADGRRLFVVYKSIAANPGFVGQVAIINPGGGIMVVDSLEIGPGAAAVNVAIAVWANTAGIGVVSRAFDVGRPFAEIAAGMPLPQRIPVGADADNTAAAYGSLTSFHYVRTMAPTLIKGPWVFPGVEPQEELWIRTSAVNQAVSVVARGRWYPGITFIGP